MVRTILAAIAAAFLASPAAIAWGGLGHRLTGLIAASHLTPVARQHVAWLLGPENLADVAGWADRQVDAEVQTSYWHYVNIPQGAHGYERDRDCPRQPGVAAGARTRATDRREPLEPATAIARHARAAGRGIVSPRPSRAGSARHERRRGVLPGADRGDRSSPRRGRASLGGRVEPAVDDTATGERRTAVESPARGTPCVHISDRSAQA